MLLHPDRYWWLVPGSLIAAFFWQFWPLGTAIRQWTPDALVLITIYWTLRRPQQMHLGWVFLIGLLRDGIEGVPLGANTLALIVIAYAVQLLHQQIRLFAIWQQAFIVMALCAVYQLIGDWAQLLDPHHNNQSLLWLPAIITGLCWPACHLVLRQLEEGSLRRPIRS
ncbi:MAG TPA: rod shape-determining protein MreD [Pseudomonadales bacterium]|nr:rod shape-determining protein MreD [Pseudomonadales bacterium]